MMEQNNVQIKSISKELATELTNTPGKIYNIGLFLSNKLEQVLTIDVSNNKFTQYEVNIIGNGNYNKTLWNEFISKFNPTSVNVDITGHNKIMRKLVIEENFVATASDKEINKKSKEIDKVFKDNNIKLSKEYIDKIVDDSISMENYIGNAQWFCGGSVYRIDFPDGKFYIGSATKNIKLYNGSGAELKKYKNNFSNNNFKKTIIKDNFATELEMRKCERLEIVKYFEETKNGSFVKTTEDILNTIVTSTTISHITICPECGGKNGHHFKTCSQFSIQEPCPECGSYTTHKPWCSKSKEKKICSECGAKHGRHRTWCSKYVSPEPCPICGKLYGHHDINCPNYSGVCPECGATGHVHKKGCSHYKFTNSDKICDICGGKGGKHKSGCPRKKVVICEECGASGGRHKKTCSKYVEPKPCSECGGIRRHLKKCSMYKRKSKRNKNN